LPDSAGLHRFLLDEGVPKSILHVLSDAGYDAKRVQDLGPRGISNGAVVRLASSAERILVSRDSDFIKLGRMLDKSALGVVYLDAFRDEPDKLAVHFEKFVEECLRLLKTCAVVSLGERGPECILQKRP